MKRPRIQTLESFGLSGKHYKGKLRKTLKIKKNKY